MISIIISTIGNCPENYMRQAIESALQTSQEITKEILIIENSQNNEINNFFLQYKKDQRIKIIRAQERLNMADCWNLGLEHCTQKWHLLLHDDDFINSKVFNQLSLKTLNDDNFGFISFDFYLLKNKRIKGIRREGSLEGIIKNIPKFVSTLVHNKNFKEIGGWDAEAGHGLDILQFIKLHQKYSSLHINNFLGAYRIHTNNASNRLSRESSYSKSLPYILTQCYKEISDVKMRRKLTFLLTSFSYPHQSFISRAISFILGKLGKRLWFENA